MKFIIKIACFAFAVLMISQVFLPQVAAAATTLITIDGTSVYSDWTEDDVAIAFGSPKLITPSAFGGNASTYYGDNYGKYLYIETDSTGKIVSYSTFIPNYQTSKYSYNDIKGSTVNSLMGYFCSEFSSGKIWAGCYYNSTISQFAQYAATWKSDPERYLAGLQKQASLMMKALAKVLENEEVNTTFNEELFKANNALKEQGSNLYSYAKDLGKSKYVKIISKGTEFLIGNAYMPNPLMYAQCVRRYNIPDNMTYGCFDFTFGQYSGSSTSGIYFVDAAMLDKGVQVPMTAEEEALLDNARKIYKQSIADFNAAAVESYFQTEYQYESCPLIAGVMKPGILKGTLGLINAIRAGAGLPLLSLSQQLCDGAQAKAVLTSYLLANDISYPDPHNPPQPEGVSDAFYTLSGNGSGENLYMTGILGGDYILDSIRYALQEAYGDPIACGHRYNLLDPDWKDIGFGVCNGQGVHKMSGMQSNDVDMVAWPSKGIMLTDANYVPQYWTAKFYGGSYKTTSSTYVSVKNLNSGSSWVIDDPFCVGTNEISYHDSSITYSDGDICEITISNLLKDGSPAEYTYRTVFAAAFDGNSVSDGILKGTVTSFGNDSDAEVKIGVYDGDTEIASDTVSGSGEKAYEITGLPGGIYTVKVTKENHVAREYTVAIIKEETVKNVEIWLLGDVNGDGKMNAKDYSRVYAHINKTNLLTGYALECGDVTGNDGKVTIEDYRRIYSHIRKTMPLW